MVIALTVGCLSSIAAENAEIDQLLERLADPEAEDWESLERRILGEWSKSGSAAMDLLLERGTQALRTGDLDIALEHLTALTDHAPDFAEGWNTRAIVLFRMGMYGPAIEDIGRALTINPNHFGAMSGLAAILQELGMAEESLKLLEMVQAINPHHPGLEQRIEAQKELLNGQRL